MTTPARCEVDGRALMVTCGGNDLHDCKQNSCGERVKTQDE